MKIKYDPLLNSLRTEDTFDTSTIDKVALGLDKVDNTADKDKPLSDAAKTEFGKYALREEFNAMYEEVRVLREEVYALHEEVRALREENWH